MTYRQHKNQSNYAGRQRSAHVTKTAATELPDDGFADHPPIRRDAEAVCDESLLEPCDDADFDTPCCRSTSRRQAAAVFRVKSLSSTAARKFSYN
jgi:hypothetical protein